MKRTPLKRKTPMKNRSSLKARAPMKRPRKKAMPKEIREHWGRIASLGCIITRTPNPTIHHCKGGSVRERWGEQVMSGVGQKGSDWLTVPLSANLHVGNEGIDSGMGVRSWEAMYGRQVDLLDRVREIVLQRWGYCIFEKAGIKWP